MQIHVNGMIIFSLVIHAFLIAVAYGEYPTLSFIMAGFVGLSLLGVLFLLAGSRRVGAYLVLIGTVVFVPIGLIGVLGARKVLDGLEEERLAKRRTDS